MSNLKAGDLCLVVGYVSRPYIVGQTCVLMSFVNAGQEFKVPSGQIYKASTNYAGWLCQFTPDVGRLIPEKHLIKISGHKDPEKVTKQEGIEA